MSRAALFFFVLLLGAGLVLAPSPADAGPASPAKLVEAYFKAKKPEDRAAARAAIEAAPPLTADEVAPLRDLAIRLLHKRGRKLSSKGRSEWFGGKKKRKKRKRKGQDGDAEPVHKGLYITSGKGQDGIVLALHGGGPGSGDAGSAQGSFSGVVSAVGMRGIYPEVLEKTEYGWTDPPATEKWVLELLKAGRRTWKTDPNRVYVTGHSMGGYGTWTYGSIHADLFAGGAAFAGAPTVYWKKGMKDKEAEGVIDGVIPNLYNLPLFVYQSLDDPNVPAAANVRAAAELKAAHASDPAGWRYVYEQVDGRGHGFPKKGPRPGVDWMVSHVRDPRPTTIRWQPVRGWKKTFYWLRWEQPWLGSLVTAKVDRARNAVDIVVTAPRSAAPRRMEQEREGYVGDLSVYVDDRLVDLTKDVVLTVDGKERFRGRPVLSLATLVDSAAEREDGEYTFAARLKVGPASSDR